MPKTYTIYAGIITDEIGTPIGLAFPIDVGDRVINGPNAWQLYLKEQRLRDEALAAVAVEAIGEDYEVSIDVRYEHTPAEHLKMLDVEF